jgi:hypothetical protein
MKIAGRVLGSLGLIAVGVFVWVFVGVAWCFCSMGWHKKAERAARLIGQHGAATIVGGGIGMLLLVGCYWLGEWFGCRIMGRC